MSKQIFTFRPALTDKTKMLIVPADYSVFKGLEIGSYVLAPARVLGLTYGEYLQYIATKYPDKVIIKPSKGYVVSYWTDCDELKDFIKLLNDKVVI